MSRSSSGRLFGRLFDGWRLPLHGLLLLPLWLSACAVYDAKPYPTRAEREGVTASHPSNLPSASSPPLVIEMPSAQDQRLSRSAPTASGDPASVTQQALPPPVQSSSPILSPQENAAWRESPAPTAGPTSLAPPPRKSAGVSDPGFDALLKRIQKNSVPEPETAAPNFIWPVEGEITTDFGPQKDGTSHAGINLKAPRGAPVRAAASGTVVYAGSDLASYGNLVLIRHEGGWITTYAHLERMFVANNGIVTAGDMIGTAGMTGKVPSPQLHFEIRKGETPVDPVPLLPPTILNTAQ